MERPVEHFGVKREILHDTGSEEALNMVKNWVDECSVTHHECSMVKVPQLPTRVIDIGKPDSDHSTVKLCSRKGERYKFAALCYCWSEQPTITTTKSTLEDRLAGIKVASCPKAFQDAITITRRLGLRYLWIDALCIIQDDESDWNTETSRMHIIFGSAFCTIASTWSDSSEKGIFSTRSSSDSAVPKYVNLSRTKGRTRHKINHNFRIARSPLLTRGWALQEHILCRRVIHYDTDEIRLECKKGARCECSGQQIPKLRGETLLTGPSELSGLSRAKLFRTWWDLIEEYSLRNLTVPSDKLPAVYGLAQRFQSFGLGLNVAGLWKSELIASLAWTTAYQPSREFPRRPKHRPIPYRAPTWSWASIDAQIAYPALHVYLAKTGETRCQIIDVQSTASGHAGAVKSAYVRISSAVVPVTVERPSNKAERADHQQQWGIRRKGIKSWFTPDAPLDDTDATRYKQSIRSRFFAQESATCLLLAAGNGSEAIAEGGKRSGRPEMRGEADSWRAMALVLRRSQAVPGTFERIGLVVICDSAARELFRAAKVATLTVV